MNGPQDLGGQQGFGPVAPEANEPLFHAPWEARAMAVTIASGALGAWTIDESRHARESLPWVTYYGSSYYEIWIRALEKLLERHGFVAADERAAGHALHPAPEAPRVLRSESVAGALARGTPCDREIQAPARFAAGDRVRAVVMNPPGHTRLPRYARGREGVVEAVQGGFVFPDSNAHGGGDRPQWLYTVVFRAEDLWGADAEPGSDVSIDAWKATLNPPETLPAEAPDAPVFAAPWEAKAFALTVLLRDRGVFTWSQWAEALSAECARGGPYYEAWLRALERLLGASGLVGAAEIAALARDWERAAEATPHGTPIRLENLRP